MGKVLTKDLRPGMKVEADVFNDEGKMIVPVGTVLTDNIITRLEFHSVVMVDVLGEGFEGDGFYEEAFEKEKHVESYFTLVRSTPAFKEYKKEFDTATNEFKSKCNSIVSENAPIETDNMLEMVAGLMTRAKAGTSFYDMLHSMRDYDDESYAHSINVALITNVFCKWLKMSDAETNLATLCGLLHDIGKMKVPYNILRKTGKLTNDERNVVQRHTVEGFNILESQDIDSHIKNTALMHHERYDGTGYPLGIKGSQIDPYARLVAISDVYDAITSPRVYRAALCPFTAIEIFEEEGLQKYDIHYIMTFLQNVVYTYIQHPVRLSDGRVAQIIEANPNAYSKPLVQVGDEFMDLRDHRDIHIVEIL